VPWQQRALQDKAAVAMENPLTAIAIRIMRIFIDTEKRHFISLG
jgi:hypothetical protein